MQYITFYLKSGSEVTSPIDIVTRIEEHKAWRVMKMDSHGYREWIIRDIYLVDCTSHDGAAWYDSTFC